MIDDILGTLYCPRLAPRNDLSRRIGGNSAYGVNPSPLARAVAADDHIILANIQDAFSIGVKTLPRVELAVLELILPVVCLIHPPIVHSLVPPRQSGKLFRFTARPSRFDPCSVDVCTGTRADSNCYWSMNRERTVAPRSRLLVVLAGASRTEQMFSSEREQKSTWIAAIPLRSRCRRSSPVIPSDSDFNIPNSRLVR